MSPILAIVLSLAEPLPLDMPRATAYLVEDKAGRTVIEDRYPVADLWVSQTVAGRWMDEDGRIFAISDLKNLPPPIADAKTRCDYEEGLVPVDRKDPAPVFRSLYALSPVAPVEKGVPPRFLPVGVRDLRYWEGTNQNAIVCTYLREGADFWRLAAWELVEGDDREKARAVFEDEFLAKRVDEKVAPLAKAEKRAKKRKPTERELARRDIRHDIAPYPDWHFTDGEDFVVIDDLSDRGRFVTALTNELQWMRKRYAAAVPAPVDVSNTLAVIRIYANRDEYLDALEDDRTNLVWSAAYWCQGRRELVACLPQAGAEKLMRTMRHEAFHQYLSYAVSMIAASPWFNEGYAEYFEDEDDARWDLKLSADDLERLAVDLPKVLSMNYEQFYEGSNAERHLKYRLAWSIAYFIEKGAPEVPFTPFKDLKRDYLKTLYKTRDMRQATSAAFRNAECLVDFVNAWKKFWKERL